MQTLIQDLRYGTRMLLKRPGFTLIAVLTLALGIGANTAIFSLVNTILLRPLPVTQPEQLMSLNNKAINGSREFPAFSYPAYRDLRDRNKTFSGLFTYRFAPVSLSHNGNNERVWGYLASGNYFDILGVRAARGRLFTVDDDKSPGAHPVAVITYKSWQKRFAGDEQIIGREVLVNGRSFTIIGVAPPDFYGTEISYSAEMWFPVMMQKVIEPANDYLERRGTENLFLQGRMKEGISPRQAEADLQSIAAQLAGEFPDDQEGKTITLSPPGLFGSFMRGAVLGFTGVMMLIVGLVLLLACTNLANLLLARATERRKEIAIRLAIGAKRGRLLRQLLTESVLLSVVGGGLGLLLAYWLVDALMKFKPPMDIPLSTELHVDYRVLLFTLGVSVLTGVVFGLLPALQATRPDLVPALKDETSVGGYRRSWLRNGLVVLQMSLSLVLLICAGLVLRGLQRAQFINPGFDPQDAFEMSFDLSLQGYDAGRTFQFKKQLLERTRNLPGVQHAGLTDFMPLSMNINYDGVFVEGQPEVRGANVPTTMVGSVSPGFREALGIPLLYGRDITEQDDDTKPRVALINETFARRFWQNPDAVGKRFSFRGVSGPWIEVIGVVQDGKYFSLSEEATPFTYVNLRPAEGSFLSLAVRTSGDVQSVMTAVRREIQQLDARLPVYNMQTLATHMGLSLFPARVAATLLGSFGLLALLLAAIGLFGVMSYAVSQRTREIGIRMALGAGTREILKLVMGQGLILTLSGIGIGLGLALLGTRLLATLLYGVSATDPVIFSLIALLLTLVAVLACWLPARRAARVDPMVALRCE